MEHDYIVVGAGAAGCALASRLSENAAHRVLLIEAGGDFRGQESSLNFRQVVASGGRHWPGLEARVTRGRSAQPCLRGLGLGGSSAIHALTAVRGIPADFDAWAAMGCTGWSWNEVLPSFIRLEEDADFGDRPYHGKTGPVPLARNLPEQWGSVSRALVEAADGLGYAFSDDINAPDAIGAYAAPLTVRDGKRVSSADAYLVHERKNLEILAGSLVDRVEFEGSRAVGVRVNQVVHRAGSVILCAGAIHSPAILMRSGIGDADALRALGVEPRMDLPGVGQNLCEHPLIRLGIELRAEARAASLDGVVNDCGLRTDDLTIFAANFSGSTAQGGLGVSLMQPCSRGTVMLRSSAPEIDPAIDFDLLSDERDVAGLQAGVRLAARLLEHRAFQAIAESQEISFDDPETLRQRCQGFFHAAGTCRMGSVVDADGFVTGVDGLRVADASIMPQLPRAATYLTATMIGEHIFRRMKRQAANTDGCGHGR